MTTSLRTVINKVGKLSTSEQNAIAELLNEELKWNKSFYTSQEELSLLAQEAIVEYKKGKTKPLNIK